MRGVQVKTGAPHEQVFWVWRLQDQQPTWLQDPQGLCHPNLQQIKIKVLNHVKGADEVIGIGISGSQHLGGITQLGIQTIGPAPLEHPGIHINALGFDPLSLQ